MFIRTTNLMLRPVFPEDWQQIHHCIASEGRARPYCAEHARAWCSSAADRGPFALAITLPEVTGAPIIGHISLALVEDAHDDAEFELSFWIAPDHQARGYASEAAAGIIRTAQALGIGRIAAGYFIDNPASGAVLRKCGFAETGEVRPSASKVGGGELVLARRYELDLHGASAGLLDISSNLAA